MLTELGTPEQLAAKYSGDERLAFISGMYFIVYKKVLSIVLPIVATAMFFGNVVTVLVNEKLNELGVLIPKLLFSAVGGGIGAALKLSRS